MCLQGILFDFDGVIADTEPRNAAYLAAALQRFGITMTEQDQRELVGVQDKSTLERLLARAKTPVSPEELEAERRRCGNTYQNDPHLAPQPGLVCWLDALQQSGIRTAVVSSTRTQLVVTALNRMRLLRKFDVVVCGDMVERRKPEPDSYQLALRWLDLAPERCIAIEDSPTGIRAAKVAGLRVIGYTGGSVRLDISQADFAAASFQEIAQSPMFEKIHAGL